MRNGRDEDHELSVTDVRPSLEADKELSVTDHRPSLDADKVRDGRGEDHEVAVLGEEDQQALRVVRLVVGHPPLLQEPPDDRLHPQTLLVRQAREQVVLHVRAVQQQQQ